jgi:two-component system response regulator QseB
VDAIVLDLMLPDRDGLSVLSTLRKEGFSKPILIVTARDSVDDRVAGLDVGADDYLTKPFSLAELLARLRALRRRHLDTARQLPVGAGRLDLDTREFRPDPASGTAPVQLSERECALLAALAARPGQVHTRENLLFGVFTEAESPIVVDTYVHYLRRKLGRDVIRTVRGRGYRLGSGDR